MKLKMIVILFLLSVAEIFGADASQQPPQVAVPTEFHGPAAAGPADVARWSKEFNDPQLDRFVERALRSNLDLQIAEARLREVRANRSVAASDLYPHLGVSGSLTRAQNNLGSAFGPSSGGGGTTNIFVGSQAANFGTTGLDASWELDLFGGKRAKVRAAVADLAGAEDARRNVLVSLLAELARNYMEIRTSQRHVAITESRIQAQQQTLELTRRRFDAGQAGMLDVTRAEAESASVRGRDAASEGCAATIDSSSQRLGGRRTRRPELRVRRGAAHAGDVVVDSGRCTF